MGNLFLTGCRTARATGSLLLVLAVTGLLVCRRNQQPVVAALEGPQSVVPGDTADYRCRGVDPESESLEYLFEWGDSMPQERFGPCASESTLTAHHVYHDSGAFRLRVRACDPAGAVSEWTEMTVAVAPPGAPPCPVGPDQTYQYAPAGYRLGPLAESVAVEYEVDWGDGAVETTAVVPCGDTLRVEHTWTDAGAFVLRCRVRSGIDGGFQSQWSDSLTVIVYANHVPINTRLARCPWGAVINRRTRFEAVALDPDGDSISYQFEYDVAGGLRGDWTPLSMHSVPVPDYHTYLAAGEFLVRVRARDAYGASSDWSDTSRVVVDTNGVVWTWVTPEDSMEATGSALVLPVEGRECVYVGSWGDEGLYYAVDVEDGSTWRQAGPGGEFGISSHAAYCAATDNIIVGDEDGALYAFSPSLELRWEAPDSLNPHQYEWCVPAVNGNRIYFTLDDDFLFCLVDSGTSVHCVGSWDVPGITEHPVIDAAGNVIVVTETGRLLKSDPDLATVLWDTLLCPRGWLASPVLGVDGTLYLGTSEGDRTTYVRAYRPDLSLAWQTQVSGSPWWLLLGDGAVYVVLHDGDVYRLDLATGAIVWQADLPGNPLFFSCPFLTDDGFIYLHEVHDSLYCVRQSDGALVWECDLLASLPLSAGASHADRLARPSPRGPGRRGGRDYMPDYAPGLTANGDIIVVGGYALYCVAGPTRGGLAPTAWPKWQRDVHNTGKAGGW